MRKKAFELQQLYCGDNSSVDYTAHCQLNDALKSELNSIRDQFRESIKTADSLVSEFSAESVEIEVRNQYYEVMKQISLDCSEKMANFSEKVIRESVDIIHTPPPCTFEAVAIGSIARGEATPYSDLEYLFLVDESTPESMRYFETLSMISYFLMGDLGETKLSYMAVQELHGWFDDKAKNGFKIDGLAKGAGNIPTGHSPKNKNHFIVTPEMLANKYKAILNRPDPDEALRGDLTSMLTYTKSLYSYQNEDKQLLQRFRSLIKAIPKKQSRTDINMEMLQKDARKFHFVPDIKLSQKGFNVDVKKELYRFPSILLLDVCIVSECAENTSWASLESLAQSGAVSLGLCGSLKFLLAAAAHVRLSTYLHHDSHDDRMSLTQQSAALTKPSSLKLNTDQSSRRWFVPSELFTAMCSLMIPLKGHLGKKDFKKEDLATFSEETDPWWSRVTTLYYSGNYTQALSILKQKCADLCGKPVQSALHILSSLPHFMNNVLFIVSETLYWCGEHRAALQLYQYTSENNIGDTRERIADCKRMLGENDQAIKILSSITEKSAGVYYSLGHAYKNVGQYQMAEQSFLHALQRDLSSMTSPPLTDYYGDPLTSDCEVQQKIDFTHVPSPEERLSLITQSTPTVIKRLVSLGDVYRDQMKYSTAEAYYMKALRFIYDTYGEGAAVHDAANTLNNLGLTYNSLMKYDKANFFYQQALSVYQQIAQDADTIDIQLASKLYNLGINYSGLKKYDEAEDFYLKALAVYRQFSQGADDVHIANILNNLGINHSDMKQYDKAEVCYRQALTAYKEISQGDDSVGIGNTLNNLGNNYRETKQYDKAEDFYQQALKVYSKVSQSPESVSGVARTLRNLGDVYHETAQFKRAEDYYQQALTEYREIAHGADSVAIGNTLYNLGENFSAMEEYTNAVDYFKQALSIYRVLSQGADTVNIANILYKLGINHGATKHYAEAEDCHLQALSIYRQLTSGASNTDSIIASILNFLGNNYNDMNLYDKATDYYLQALSAYRKMSQGDDSVYSANVLSNLGLNYSEAGDHLKAREAQKQALAIFARFDPQNPQIKFLDHHLHRSLQNILMTKNSIAHELSLIGSKYQKRKQHNKAKDCFTQALVLYRQLNGNKQGSLDIACTLSRLAMNYCEMQLYSEADPLLNQSLSMYEALSDSDNSSNIADILCNLAVCDLYRGDKHSARHKFKNAYSIYLKVNQTNQHVHIIETYCH